MTDERITSQQPAGSPPTVEHDKALLLVLAIPIVVLAGWWFWQTANQNSGAAVPSPVSQLPTAAELRGADQCSQEEKENLAELAASDLSRELVHSLSAESIFAQASPAVVQVLVQDRQGSKIGSGSGFLVSTKGIITGGNGGR
jgi:hypothetical protein